MRRENELNPNKFRALVSSPPVTSAVPKTLPSAVATSALKAKQTYDAFLVVDVEATCEEGKNFAYPNEIIEFPVYLMKWKDRIGGQASQLEIAAEFQTFVQPTWRPKLSKFCTDLTSITQEQVDAAPRFPEVLRSLRAFLVEHGVLEKTGKRRLKFCWATDGPWDVAEFVVKQAFISQIPVPDWLAGEALDVRQLVRNHLASNSKTIRGNLNISAQLRALGLPPFVGREHRGSDDARNICRILQKLATEQVPIRPNLPINLRRRWAWMGKSGEILEDKI
ncbi:Exonuclease domain-containing protein [Mycena chlorophos]|uniref:Exonuclease domain-containing protein n=1 Tax=Mycena chlorophos TaxID=658473 RepID=A0A8H6TPK2_MYCCL|nr:Exonuclease domain-containing protein [Mycena chlorophos]